MNEDDTATAAPLEFLNSCEAGIAAAKQLISEDKEVNNQPWDPSKIRWEPAEGNRGAYERSEDANRETSKS
jgi:hypothetical protein